VVQRRFLRQGVEARVIERDLSGGKLTDELGAKAGVTLTHKSFAKAVPVVGGVVNGSVQGGLVHVGGKRILAHYQELVRLDI